MRRNTRAEERLRVCHCGWSKVTTYHGLRTHQGKNECTPRGLRILEEEQDYWRCQWEKRHQPVKRESFSEEGPHVSDTRLQVCHCGWSKETTYRGLRIHQGKNGCSPKGLWIQKEQQDFYKYQWERKHQPVRTQIFIEENSPERPSTNTRANPAAARATINGIYKPTSTTSQQATRSRPSQSDHQDQGFFPVTQVHSSVRDGPVTPPSERVVRPKERITEHQKPSQRVDRVMKDNPRKPGSYGNYQTPEATINKEPRSSPQPHLQRAGKPKAGHVLQGNRLVRDDPGTLPLEPAVRPKERDRKKQLNRPVRENPATKYSGTVVGPKQKHREDQTFLEVTMKTSIISPSLQSIDKDLDSFEILPQSHQRSSYSSMQGFYTDAELQDAGASVNSAALRDTIYNGYKPTLTTPQQATKSKSDHRDQDFFTLRLVDRSVREYPVTSAAERVVRPKEKTTAPKTSSQETTVQPKGKDRENQKLSLVKSLILTFQSSPPGKQRPNQHWIKNDHRCHTPQMSCSQRLQQPRDRKSRKTKNCG